MDKSLDELLQMTQQLASKLETVGYEEIVEFVNIREELVLNIQKQYENHKLDKSYLDHALVSILSYDDQILYRMQQLKNEASDNLNKMTTAKQQKSSYEAKYAPESMFFDKKK
ncbi:hypothetical protein [Paenibacillus sp. UNC451MF]|uniref:hypothetical protein n=1 Tax=Paenibacillus sp. UNC451MF TaxID=1449063 RepID=UPI000491A86C|nr:hypothetical protein [Paenibacillus sp. UNC451MF]